MDKKVCSNCRKFNAYYIKGYSYFIKTDCGSCSLRKNQVNKDDTCKKWNYRYSFRRDKYKVVKDGLENAFQKINEIALILEEEAENDK